MTTSAASPSLKQLALADLEQETGNTRRVLERVPDEHFSWKPHEKSFSLGALAQHLVHLMGWQRIMLVTEELDLAGVQPPALPESREGLLQAFDASAAALREALAHMDDAALLVPWTLRRGEHVIFTLPRLAVLRSVGISNVIHHRGQLTVYLRMLDVPVPSVYGPTADEPWPG